MTEADETVGRGILQLEVQSIAGDTVFQMEAEQAWTCKQLVNRARQHFDMLPSVKGYLEALLLEGQPLASDESQLLLGCDGAVTLTAVVGPARFRDAPDLKDSRIHVDETTSCLTLKEDCRLALRKRGDPSTMYPAALGPSLRPGALHYFEVKMTWRPGQPLSFRMGVCHELPKHYLGSTPDSASFWFDDGDSYCAGTRFHTGRLQTHVPMKHGDLVGLLVDLRTPKDFSLEFVLNRQATGPCPNVASVFREGEPLYTCVSFCTNHPGCQVEVTHLGDPPEDILPFSDTMDPKDPSPFRARAEDQD